MAWTTRALGQGSRVLMAAAKSSTSAATSTASKGVRRAGIIAAAPVSPALAKFLGVSEVPRTDAVKKVWEYIKLKNLQNPANKKEILCDEKLKTIFDGKDRVGFLEIARFVSQHFVKKTS